MKMRFILFILLFFTFHAYAAQDYYQFDSIDQQQRFIFLTKQLRCLVCPNQNIADSNASLAKDLRDQIYQNIEQGKSNQEILNALVSRYGNFILYRPPLMTATMGLWFGPFLILTSGIGYLVLYLFKHRNTKLK